MNLKNFFYFLPIMLYYFIESAFIAGFVYFLWIFAKLDILISKLSGTEVNIEYFQWLVLIWTIKLILFDVFKLASQAPTEIKEEQQNG